MNKSIKVWNPIVCQNELLLIPNSGETVSRESQAGAAGKRLGKRIAGNSRGTPGTDSRNGNGSGSPEGMKEDTVG